MKSKVKKYAGGTLTDSSGNPVRSSSGEPVRTRSDDEIAEDMKRPMGQSMPRAARPTVSEDRPIAGVDDYSTLGKKAGVTSPFLKENISEEVTQNISEPDSVAGKGAENLTKPYKAKSKSKVVSKKQLEESGFQSLRDYLNDQQGKSRKMASGGKTSSASSRGDGIAQRGKTKGRIC
jgi:hypothetical protein